MSDPHEQANALQIEWLLGELTSAAVQGAPLAPDPAPTPEAPTRAPAAPATEPDDLH